MVTPDRLPTNVDPNAAGRSGRSTRKSWTESDTILYALAVGAGQSDPTSELDLTSELTGHGLVALPTMAAAILQFGVDAPDIGHVDLSDVVHADQRTILHRPLPAAGELDVTQNVVHILDKGKGALIRMRADAAIPDGRGQVVSTEWSLYVRGAGGWGGPRGVKKEWNPGNGEAITVELSTRPEQALLYRLTGDRNPLHVDPVFARDAGFERPILHGLCTYGYAIRAALGVCGWDPTEVSETDGRFSRPVYPGEPLTLRLWTSSERVDFQVLNAGGLPVLDRGLIQRRHGVGTGV